MVMMVPHEAFACPCGAGDVVLRESYRAKTRECSNCKHLLGRIKVLQATLEMYMHPEQHTLDSTALLHDLNNDMEKLGLE
ncbi:hypothetical protein Tco_0793953 [Tanacetum coccineum]